MTERHAQLQVVLYVGSSIVARRGDVKHGDAVWMLTLS